MNSGDQGVTVKKIDMIQAQDYLQYSVNTKRKSIINLSVNTQVKGRDDAQQVGEGNISDETQQVEGGKISQSLPRGIQRDRADSIDSIKTPEAKSRSNVTLQNFVNARNHVDHKTPKVVQPTLESNSNGIHSPRNNEIQSSNQIQKSNDQIQQNEFVEDENIKSTIEPNAQSPIDMLKEGGYFRPDSIQSPVESEVGQSDRNLVEDLDQNKKQIVGIQQASQKGTSQEEEQKLVEIQQTSQEGSPQEEDQKSVGIQQASQKGASQEEEQQPDNLEKNLFEKKKAQFTEFMAIYSSSTMKAFVTDEGALPNFEPEKEHTGHRAKLKKIFKVIIAFILFMTIIRNAFKSFGTERIQVVSTVMHKDYNYDLNDNPVEVLYPFHWFIEINRQDIIDRVECLFGLSETSCSIYDELKCSVINKKDQMYDNCMLRAYRKHAKVMTDFCTLHYYDSGLFDSVEMTEPLFFESYYSCRSEAGVRKNEKYCEDVIKADEFKTEKELYDCYERNDVDISYYGEAKCLYENKDSIEDYRASIGQQSECIDIQDEQDPSGEICSYLNEYPQDCDLEKHVNVTSNCCGCPDGGTIQVIADSDKVTVIDYYKNCLDRHEELVNISRRYSCDVLDATYDQYEYRGTCWLNLVCVNDDSQTDRYGDTCSSVYDALPSFCGKYDTDVFISSQFCCACGGGNEEQEEIEEAPIEEITEAILECGCEEYGQRFCQYQAEDRSQSVCGQCVAYSTWEECYLGNMKEFAQDNCALNCFGVDNRPKYFEDEICLAAQNKILERRKCYKDQNLTQTSGYCDSKILGLASKEPTIEMFYECYMNAGLILTDQSLCDNLYPFNNDKVGSSENLLPCYERFGISLTEEETHIKCTNAYEDNLREEIRNQQQCLVDFGESKTADLSLIDPEITKISLDERKYVIKDLNGYKQAMENAGIPEEQFASQETYDFKAKVGVDSLKRFLDEYNFPWSPARDCELKAIIANTGEYYELKQAKATSDYQPSPDSDNSCKQWATSTPSECELNPSYMRQYCQKSCAKEGFVVGDGYVETCAYFYQDKCFYYYTDDDCEEYFLYYNKKYGTGQSDVTPQDIMYQELGNICQPGIPDLSLQLQCIEDMDYPQFYLDLNDKLEQYLRDGIEEPGVSDDFVYQSFGAENATIYCDTIFGNESQVEGRILCYDLIDQPMGPEKCFILTRVVNSDFYHYNLVYKYLCLHMNFVEMDVEASTCLDRESLQYDMLFYERNQCLKQYEQKQMPELIKEGKVVIYEQVEIIEEEPELVFVPDRETTLTNEQIEKFICQNITSLIFSSSPYRQIQNNRMKQVNQLDFAMNCGMYVYDNSTRNNLMVHYQLNNANAAKSENSYYNDDFNLSQFVINRTDSNMLQFKLTFGDDFDLIQVHNHKLYHHKINATQEKSINNYNDFMSFATNPQTTKILETHSQTVDQQLMPDQNLEGDQTLTAHVDKKTTKTLLDIPIEFADQEEIRIDFKKINNKIKMLDMENLVKEEAKRVSTLRVNLFQNFDETKVRIHYIWYKDILSALGGLLATVEKFLGSLGFIFLISYFYSLSTMIKRKYQNKIDVQQIKQFQKVVKKEIMPNLQAQIQSKQENGATPDILLPLQEELADCNKAMDSDYTCQYDDTVERLLLMEQIFKKHKPEALDDVFSYNGRNLDEWDQEEHLENTTKNNLYKERISLALSQIVVQIQQRVSFYYIYELIDNIKANKIKTKKIRNQLRITKGEVDLLKQTNIEQNLKIGDQKSEVDLLNQTNIEQNLKISYLEQRIGQLESNNKIQNYGNSKSKALASDTPCISPRDRMKARNAQLEQDRASCNNYASSESKTSMPIPLASKSNRMQSQRGKLLYDEDQIKVRRKEKEVVKPNAKFMKSFRQYQSSNSPQQDKKTLSFGAQDTNGSRNKSSNKRGRSIQDKKNQ